MEKQKLSLEEIISGWLSRQPKWYSQAMHLALRGEYSSEEIAALAAAACEEAGANLKVEESITLAPYEQSDLASVGITSREVVLKSITAVNSVNAIKPGSELRFSSTGLTVIYGNNGSGKSGYSRIIRNASTSRSGPKNILSNVFEEKAVPSASFKATVNGHPNTFVWQADNDGYPIFPEISFFDSNCASQEISGRDNEVLYTPRIIGSLTRFSRLVSDVANRIQLASDQIKAVIGVSAVPVDLRDSKRITDLLASKDEAEATRLASAAAMDQKDKDRLLKLPQLIASDPSTLLPTLTRRRNELATMRNQLVGLYKCCQADFIQSYARAQVEESGAEKAATAARDLVRSSSMLDGVGNDVWKTLWEAARAYSDNVAFPKEKFPITHQGALCPLCQQPLSEEASARMNTFEEYVKGAAEANLTNKRYALKKLVKQFTDAVASVKTGRSAVGMLNEASARESMDRLLRRLEGIDAMQEEQVLAELSVLTEEAGKSIRAEIVNLDAKIKAATESKNPEKVAQLKEELVDLKCRSWVADNKEILVSDAAKRAKKERLAAAIGTCNTRSISNLVSAVSKMEIVERMQESFTYELGRLRADKQPVSLTTHVKTGRQYQQIALEGTREAARNVLSEGEQKIVALAGFFALLDVTPGKSTVVLDDPITSLDHLWRKAVAKRIVEEAAIRPVVVFTHEPVFCNELSDLSLARDVPIAYRTVSRRGTSTGIVIEDLEWEARSVNERIKALRNEAVALRQREKAGDFRTDSELDEELRHCYSKLRSTWERAVEAVLLAGVVERGARQVHTQKLKQLIDISEEDIRTVDDNMSKCSLLTEAHDDPLTAPDAMPTIKDFEDDVKVLADWAKAVNKRR